MLLKFTDDSINIHLKLKKLKFINESVIDEIVECSDIMIDRYYES